MIENDSYRIYLVQGMKTIFNSKEFYVGSREIIPISDLKTAVRYIGKKLYR